MQKQYKITSSIGPLYLTASMQGLTGIYFKKQAIPLLKRLGSSAPQEKLLAQAKRQLKEYFAGQRQAFNIPFQLSGTTFQQKVWRELLKIPFGQTASYKQIASRIKNPRAVRAVGSANGKNPVCVIIPCHRVIAADGTIGGYSGGLLIKRKLLTHELMSING